MTNNLTHVIFKLNQDAYLWPPVATERMWACKVGEGQYKIDNIPFYARGVSANDVVSVIEEGGVLFLIKC